jgi:hypothetical protein
VVAKRVIAGTVVGALAVAAAFAVPAIGAPDTAKRLTSRPVASFFTPASADPKLAALIARNGLDAAPFRFTPAESEGTRRSPLGVVPPPAVKTGVVTLRSAPSVDTGSVGLAPIAYDLGRNAPVKRLVMPGDVKMDLAASPVGHKPIDIGTSFSDRRNTRLKATSERTTVGDARLTGYLPKDSIDVGGSYSLSRNLDVTAGVRYKSQDRDRLAPLPDAQRDSQAVYVGTAFRF